MNAFDFTVKALDGSDVALSDFKGQVLLIVNTATGCGFTPQYSELQDIYDELHESGLEILDFPCNQFADQAPGSDEEIHDFCTGRYGITFPQYSKMDKDYKNNGNIKWNFTKILINRDGEIVARYEPTANVKKIADKIKEIL